MENSTEYVALVGSFLLVALEAVVRVLTLALPSPLIALFYRASRRLVNGLTSAPRKRAEERQKSISTSIRDASDFVEMCSLAGYTAEEHVVQTKDGYLLGIHRLAWKPGEEDTQVNCGPNSIKKRVVYLHHGLLMNSEVWVSLTDRERCLPFVLVERGFDVWLGNNRGNKYSKKCIHCTSGNLNFWNFSIDEFAFHDIPDTIAYILETTSEPSLSYIGFSQGTAQAFASLAVHPKLNRQVNVFIALAPAMSPAGLSNGIVDALIKASPSVLFLLFGRRSILTSATMWESILYPPVFIRVIDMGLSFLFNWKTKNISTSQKLAAYPHLYSFTSTKSVVHWFQIIRTKSFQMYDDDVQTHLSLSTPRRSTLVARYPTRNIKTPVVLIYGGSDSLVDIRVMLRALPPQTVSTEIPHYEHLDFLWARDVDAQVFPHVFDALDCFPDAEHTKEEFSRYRTARSTSISASGSFRRHVARDTLTSEEVESLTVHMDPSAAIVKAGAAAGEDYDEDEELGETDRDAMHGLANGINRRRRNSSARNHRNNPRMRHQATEALRDYEVSAQGVLTPPHTHTNSATSSLVNGEDAHEQGGFINSGESNRQDNNNNSDNPHPRRSNSYFSVPTHDGSPEANPAFAASPASPSSQLSQPQSPSPATGRASRDRQLHRPRTSSSMMSYDSLPRSSGGGPGEERNRGFRLGAARAAGGVVTTTVAGAEAPGSSGGSISNSPLAN